MSKKCASIITAYVDYLKKLKTLKDSPDSAQHSQDMLKQSGLTLDQEIERVEKHIRSVRSIS